MFPKKNIILSFWICLSAFALQGQNHPNLLLTKSGVKEIKAALGTVPLFDKTLEEVIQEVDAEIAIGVKVPIPKDMAGGYTHERHKRNFFILQKAGNLFQITGEEKYGEYVKAVLNEYARIYPTLPVHPTKRSYATGKIFWQCLNDANWLVYVSQAYDAIYDWLSETERKNLEENLFKPFADYISIDNPQFFNRIHNHSTWANAAVGMIGLVMKDETLIKRSLYGIESDLLPPDLRDDDNGLIKLKDQKGAGFLAQLDFSFAPDGYFTEGPYYLRYAISPFLLFAKALHNNKPEIDIFNYRDAILKKATYSLLYQADPQGLFFPLNDCQKGMSLNAREVVAAVDIIYDLCGEDPQLLTLAKNQEKVVLDDSGIKVALALKEGKTQSFAPKSILYTDGANGDEGGIAILRTNEADQTCLVNKYSAQGMGHGHFDKLSFSLYDNQGEILQDYGSARWVNIDQKGGGRYLLENKTFAKQTIAHNTLVVDETSHYRGKTSVGEKYHPDLFFADLENDDCQIISVTEKNAYRDVFMHRTQALVKDASFKNPIIIDVFRVSSPDEHQYDLPFWYMGHLLSTSFTYEIDSILNPLGKSHGYQHVWKEASAQQLDSSIQVTWFGNERFYSITSSVDSRDEIIMGRSGAKDPSYNLRNDPFFLIRKNDQKDAIYASVVESHGSYNRIKERPQNPFSGINSVEILLNDDNYSVVQIELKNTTEITLAISNKDPKDSAIHMVNLKGLQLKWSGPYKLFKN